MQSYTINLYLPLSIKIINGLGKYKPHRGIRWGLYFMSDVLIKRDEKVHL